MDFAIDCKFYYSKPSRLALSTYNLQIILSTISTLGLYTLSVHLFEDERPLIALP